MDANDTSMGGYDSEGGDNRGTETDYGSSFENIGISGYGNTGLSNPNYGWESPMSGRDVFTAAALADPTFESKLDSPLGDLTPTMWDRIGNAIENKSLLEILGMGLKAVGIGANIVSGNLPGAVQGLVSWGFNTQGMPTSPVGMAYAMGKGAYDRLTATPEEFASKYETLDKEDWASRAKEATSTFPDYADLSNTVASVSRENEKELDKLFTKLGETGDYAGAIEAAKGFHETTFKQADLESALFKYSTDPEYQVIEPELRVLADKAVKEGMEPKEAAKFAYEKVKQAYKAKNFLKDFIAKKKLELEATA
jgi:hypothetical protein